MRRIGGGHTRVMQPRGKLIAPKTEAEKNLIYDPKRLRRWDALIQRIPVDRESVGAEVGIWCGDTSWRVLKQRPLCKHIMIDPWQKPDPDSRWAQSPDGVAHQDQEYYDDCYKKTLQNIEPWKDRADIIRRKSLEAVNGIEDASLDYVWIDAEHTYEGCKEDIQAWLPKVKKGGWIGGHDFDNLPRFPGIRKAVEEIFDKNYELDRDHTWFVRIK